MLFFPEKCRWAFQEYQCGPCSKCGQPSGVIQCCGCNKVFCSKDNKEHRTELHQRLLTFKQQYYGWYDNWTNDQTNQKKTLQKEQANLFDEIESWEEKSIAEIKRTANEARQKVQKLFELRIIKPEEVNKRSQGLIQRIGQAEKVDDFHELHLEQWATAIDCLRRGLEGWITCFDRIEYTESFIKKLIVREIDVSSSINDFPNFDDIDGQSVVLRRPRNGGVLSDNQREFQAGTYRYHFKPFRFSFGIAPKYTVMGKQSQASSVQYGWTADNRVYIDGIPTRNHTGHISNTELGDNFMLEVNCEQQFLHLTNQLTGQIHQINVDTKRCPLPWQLVIQYSGNNNRRSLQEF